MIITKSGERHVTPIASVATWESESSNFLILGSMKLINDFTVKALIPVYLSPLQ